MFEKWKNLKLLKKFQNINPKSLWLNFSASQKMNRKDYVEMLTENSEIQTLSDERRLEVMVREQISKEFPNMLNSSAYEFLVDAVIHNIKKKQLQATDDVRFE